MGNNPVPADRVQPSKPADRLRAAANHLHSFASVAPLVFAVAEGDRLICVRDSDGLLCGPDPYDALNRFYSAIMEIDQLFKELGCEDREGNPLSEITVMAWSSWMCLNLAKQWPAYLPGVLTLGKSLVRWWNTTSRQDTGADPTHPWCRWIEASSPEFAMKAAAEANAIAASSRLHRQAAKDATKRSSTSIRSSTPPLDPHGPEWMTLKECKEATGIKAATLGVHRRKGWTDDDRMLGQDVHGRVWRRKDTALSQPYFYRPTVGLSTKGGKNSR